eukprot:TRINITY_DN39_c0_g1_i1.p1 TRINITY_DN39_c0_g1~~TRINITY_DN39_c0_g1_i1.p1  ORF type:complete len:351 (+),score=64.00 TRINITY_DN39_c0_g1_i1:59-1111(+)
MQSKNADKMTSIDNHEAEFWPDAQSTASEASGETDTDTEVKTSKEINTDTAKRLAEADEEAKDEDIIKAKALPLKLQFGSWSTVGSFHSNEDKCLTIASLTDLTSKAASSKTASSSPSIGVFAVIDGHGGDAAAQFVVDHFPYLLVHSIDDSGLALHSALHDACTTLDERFSQWASTRADESGACLNAVVFVGHFLVCACVGDCRAILYLAEDDKIVPLSVDHVYSNPAEKKRLDEASIPISENRICGILEPTRTIGDLDIKKSFPEGNIPVPEIKHVILPIRDKTSKVRSFVLLASDGVFSVLSSQQAVATIKDELGSGHTCEEASKTLCEKAKKNGSTDDITVVCVSF